MACPQPTSEELLPHVMLTFAHVINKIDTYLNNINARLNKTYSTFLSNYLFLYSTTNEKENLWAKRKKKIF